MERPPMSDEEAGENGDERLYLHDHYQSASNDTLGRLWHSDLTDDARGQLLAEIRRRGISADEVKRARPRRVIGAWQSLFLGLSLVLIYRFFTFLVSRFLGH